MKKPSPYQITAFTHAVRERSFSRAADVMGVTQSSVTQHVANLERMMGTSLFVRRREGLELTQAARDLFEISDRWQLLEELMEEKIADIGDLTTGRLQIISNTPRPAMQAISVYNTRFPKIVIDFRLVSWTLGMEMLRDRNTDVAIIANPETEKGMYSRVIQTTKYKVFVRRDHPVAGRRNVSLAELAQYTLITPELGSLTEKLLREKASRVGIRLEKHVIAATFPVVREAVLHGIGVGFMLDDGQFPFDELVAIDVDEFPETHELCLVTPTEKRDLRLIKTFCDIAIDLSFNPPSSKSRVP